MAYAKKYAKISLNCFLINNFVIFVKKKFYYDKNRFSNDSSWTQGVASR